MASVNSLPNVLTQFDAAAERLGLDDGLRRRSIPHRVRADDVG
ncbi:MAG: hypothetical protein ACHQ7N_04645 [Candidatus Methylomirabilales bacterium]